MNKSIKSHITENMENINLRECLIIRTIMLCAMCCFLCFGIISCSDEKVLTPATIEMPEGANLMELEMWSYELPFSITTEGEWIIETTGDFCYATPSQGRGSATVQLAILDNNEEERQKGELKIIFPNSPENSVTYTLEQKWAGDYDDNAVEIGRGNSIYAVGYGYDATNGYATPNSIKNNPILKFAEMVSNGEIVYGTQQTNLDFQSYTGSTITDISNELQVKAGVSGGSCGFKGEFNSSFNSSYFQSNNHEYALVYYNILKERILVVADIEDLRSKEYMTTKAYKAINGLSSAYENNRKGYKQLIMDYGTHMPLSANLGGRIRYSMSVDISKVTSEYDINAFASASYKNAFVNVNASVDEKFKSSYESNKKNCQTSLSVTGGSTSSINALIGENGFTSSNVTAWQNSLTNDNMALVGFLQGDLIPLYELVDQDNYPDRYKGLKAYMEGTQMLEDFPPIETSFQCGTVAKFNVPTFSDDETLIKEVSINGHVVAQICNEFIPLLNKSQRVTVVYPVIDNKPRYNMGYFIGNSSHKPCRVAWSGKNVTIKEYDQSAFGANSILYLRGATITPSTDMPKNSIVSGKVDGVYLAARDICRDDPANGQYPIVKIFDLIWTKTNYRGRALNDGTAIKGWWSGISQSDGYTLYVTRLPNFAPTGWSVPSSNDYQEIINYLVNNDITGNNIAKAFFDGGGALGYNCHRFEEDNTADYWTSDPGNNPKMIHFDTAKGTVAIVAADKSSIDKSAEDRNVGKHNPVRFIKKL